MLANFMKSNHDIFDEFHRVLVRAVSYATHGLIPARYRRLNCSFQSNDMAPHINSNYDFFSCVFADRYNREEVVASLGREINLNPPLTLGQLPDTSEELLKLDQVFTKC